MDRRRYGVDSIARFEYHKVMVAGTPPWTDALGPWDPMPPSKQSPQCENLPWLEMETHLTLGVLKSIHT